MDEQKIVEKVVKRLEDTIGESVADNIKTQLQTLVKAEFDRIDKRLDSIDRIVTGTDESLADDRKDIGYMRSAQEQILQNQKEILDQNNRQTKTIVSKVTVELEKSSEEALKQIPEKAKEGIKEYVEVTKPKVIKVIEEATKKRKWFFWKK
jgi:hypothetical protein